MKTLIKPEAELRAVFIRNQTSPFIKKAKSSKNIIDFKFYQKLSVLLIALSTFLIFPESPKELENVCKSYFSRISCNVW